MTNEDQQTDVESTATDNQSPMGDYEMALIRHIAGKALVESDAIDIEEFSLDEIETALWAVASEASHGFYLTHPKERDLFKTHPEVAAPEENSDDEPTGREETTPTVHGVVCSECGKGEWQDYEHGDTIDRCPYCESQTVLLVDPEEYDAE